MDDALINECVGQVRKALVPVEKGKWLGKLILYAFLGLFQGREIGVFDNCESLD